MSKSESWWVDKMYFSLLIVIVVFFLFISSRDYLSLSPNGHEIIMFVIFGKGQRYIKVIPVITVLFPYVQDIMMFVIFGKRSTLYKSDSRNNCSISLLTRYNHACNI